MKNNPKKLWMVYASIRSLKIFMIMRIMVFLLLLGVIQVMGKDSYSQNARVSMDLNDVTVGQVLNTIESQTDFYFIFNQKLVDIDRRVSVRASDEKVDKILNQIFAGTDIKHMVLDRQIVLSPGSLLDTRKASAKLQQQGVVVQGKVMDEKGEPLPGVNIVEKGTGKGTISGDDGSYSITVSNSNATLVFSFVGYTTKEVSVAGKKTINVTLPEEAIGLQEVVAIGYGTVKKSDLTGSVSSVKADEILASPIQSVDQGLAGRASGVQLIQTSGMPGSIASIRIRGTSSLEGGNEPLYVIDGFPIYNGGGFGNTGGKDKLSGLSMIDPQDIASIEVLKDASATAIYGARAANGVILITTKSGQEGKNVISFNFYVGTQKVTKKIDVMNAYDYGLLVNEAYTNDGLPPYYDDEKMEELKANPEGTDWQDEIFRHAMTQNYQLSFSGGDNKTRYNISGGYSSQDGIIINTDFKRYSGRINLERDMMKRLKVGTHFTMSRTLNHAVPTATGAHGGVVTQALLFNPILPVYSDPEKGEYTPVNVPGILEPNPVATAKEMVHETTANRILGNLYAELKIIEGLTLKVSFGTDVISTKYDTYIPSYIYEGGGTAVATVASHFNTNWLNENTLNYFKNFKNNQSLNVLAGVTFQKNHYEGVSGSSQGFVNDILQENSLQSGAVYNAPTSGLTDWGLVSYLGRVNYNIQERYLFSLNGRVDGSSRFGENNKYAFFPSAAFAWRIIDELFMDSQNVFSNLKFRISYGLTGNQEIGLYNSLPTLSNTTYTIGNVLVTGFRPNKIPNPDLRWEKSGEFDVGLDMGFLKNRIRITSDYYYRKTSDLIYNVAIPYVSGFNSSIQNIGSMENHGFEFSLESYNVETKDFKWYTNFNISFNRNKVLDLGGEEYKDIGYGDGGLKTGSIHRLFIGKPIGLFYGYVFDGIFQNQEEVDAGPKGPTSWVGGMRWKDISGPNGTPDGVIDATYDRAIIGDPNPKFIGGMNNTFSYKGLELTVFMQWSYGNKLFNYNGIRMYKPSGGQNVYAVLKDRWTPDNPSDRYPKATTNRASLFSDYYLEDGSYLKFKTISLAYNFSRFNIPGISNLRVYFTLQNYITFTKYTGYDPEVSYRGATNLELGEDFGGYPQAKTFMVGVKLDIK